MLDIIQNLASQTGFATLDWKNYIMLLVAFFFMYLAIAKGFEPLLLVPISFGMFLVNMFPSIIQEGGLDRRISSIRIPARHRLDPVQNRLFADNSVSRIPAFYSAVRIAHVQSPASVFSSSSSRIEV